MGPGHAGDGASVGAQGNGLGVPGLVPGRGALQGVDILRKASSKSTPSFPFLVVILAIGCLYAGLNCLRQLS